MKKLFTLLVVIFSAAAIQAQEFNLPDYRFKEAGDYAKYEKYVVEATEWLVNTSPNADRNKRNKAGTFITEWAVGTPDVHFGLDERVLSFINPQIPDYFTIFIGGWAGYAIDNRVRLDSMEPEAAAQDIDSVIAGLEAVMEFYVNNSSVLPKERGIEKYIKLKKQAKLREYLEKIYE